MGTIDMKKLDIAIVYLQRITDGKNPVNNLPADEEDVLNNPNVIRCMYFVKEVLEEVKRNDGSIGKRSKMKTKEKQDFPIELLQSFEYKEDLPISYLTKQFNEMIDENIYKKLNYFPIIQWLKNNGYLEEYKVDDSRKINIPTEKGKELGIRSEMSTSSYGQEYIRVIYTKQAQEYIVKNIKEIYKKNK